jgi:hypothetical protein
MKVARQFTAWDASRADPSRRDGMNPAPHYIHRSRPNEDSCRSYRIVPTGRLFVRHSRQ